VRLIDEFLWDRKKIGKVVGSWADQQERLGEIAKFLITDNGGLEISSEHMCVVLTLEDAEHLHRFLREWFDPESSARQRKE